MLTAQAKEAVEQAAPRRKVAFVVFVDVGDEYVRAARIRDLKRRLSTLERIYRQAKQPLLDAVTDYSSDGMKVVNNLEGTPQLVVSAPAKTWKRVIEERTSLMSGPGLEFRPNVADWVAL